MVTLYVTEKPQVARDIAKALKAGRSHKGYWASDTLWITWCIGHLVTLCEPHEYNPQWKKWSFNTLPVLPHTFKLKPIPHTQHQWEIVKTLLTHPKVSVVVNACDAGREGELIFRYIYGLSGSRKKTQRMWLSSLTEHAIQQAHLKLQPSETFDALSDAAHCRAEADWLIGINATRALTLRDPQRTLRSVGRVQTPTLSTIVKRTQEISFFTPKPYWQLKALFTQGTDSYEGLWHNTHAPDKESTHRIFSETEAQHTAREIEHQEGLLKDIHTRELAEPPPFLFDLTSLQRYANTRFGMSAQHTLDTAQALYEKHTLLTYPRTDSTHLPTEHTAVVQTLVHALQDTPHASLIKPLLHKNITPRDFPRVFNDALVTDHHAIIPTTTPASKRSLSTHEQNIYNAVVLRFIAAFYPKAIYALTRFTTVVGNHTFVSRGKTCVDIGWHTVEKPHLQEKNTHLLPYLKAPSKVVCSQTEIAACHTQPPPFYTDASLLKDMEEAHLGTPATRASVIETLLDRKYILREKKHLTATQEGIALIQQLNVNTLKSPALTATWEKQLQQIAQGTLSRDEFMRNIHTLTQHVVLSIQNTRTCPQCSQGILIKGHTAVGCSRWKEGCAFRRILHGISQTR